MSCGILLVVRFCLSHACFNNMPCSTLAAHCLHSVFSPLWPTTMCCAVTAITTPPPKQQINRDAQELDEKAKSALGAKGGLPPTTVVDRLRKRLRMNGYRCHLTLQVCSMRSSIPENH